MEKVLSSRYKVGPDGRKVSSDGFKCSSFTPEDAYVACVAVKRGDGSVQIRDTKDVANTTLTFTAKEWTAFIRGVKNGEFDI